MIVEGKSGSNDNTKVTDRSGLNFYLIWLCRNHAFDRFSQSFLEIQDKMNIEGI